MLNLVLWILFGFVAGVVLYFLEKEEVRGGVLGSIMFGVAGSVLGGALSELLLGSVRQVDFVQLVVAFSFSLILLHLRASLFADPGRKI